MAADKNSAMTKLNDIMKCCICLNTFNDPRILPCIHTFCFLCLQDMAEKSNKKIGEEIYCPVCRKEFTIPNDGIRGVQKNFFIASLTEIRNALNQSKKAPACDVCKANNDATEVQIPEATIRCLNCRENLCEGCCKMHKSFRMSRNHEFRKIGSEIGEEEVVKSLEVMICDVHRGKLLDYYCADCKKVVCVSCFVESHKTHDCKDVNTVEEKFRQSIKSSADIISTLAEELLAKRKNTESKEEFLKKIVAKEREILQRSKELKDMVDEHTKSLLCSLHEIKNRHLKEIQVAEEELDRRFSLLESFTRYCDELSSKGSASEVCRSKDELLRRADELEEDHEAYIMRPRVSFDVTFQATESDNFPKTANGNIVGSVNGNVEQMEGVCVVISGDYEIHKINLSRRSETPSGIQNLPTKTVRYFAAAAVYNNTMFITGFGESLNEIWKYNFASGWERCGSLVQGRQHHCAEFIGETLYICGGSEQGIVMDSIEAYNALTEKSATAGQLIFGSSWAACVAYSGLIYVFGGLDNQKELLSCVQMYNPVENSCTLLLTPTPRCDLCHRVIIWETYAIVQLTDTFFIFDIDNKIWQERQQFETDAFCAGMVLENERIFILGGARREDDAQGNKQWIHNNDVRYARASSIVNNEATKWKTHSHLPTSVSMIAAAELIIVK